MVQVTEQEIPKEWRAPLDLFEVGFVYVFLPLVVSTMDRPPLQLGGKILLWMVAWFFLRRLSDLPEGKGWLRNAGLSSVIALAGVGLVGGCFAASGPQIAAQVAQWLLQVALVTLPASALVFLYLPARFSTSAWIAPGYRPLLPAVAFAGLHLSSGIWQAPLLAFAGGYLVARLRLPLWAAVLGQWGVAVAGARWLW